MGFLGTIVLFGFVSLFAYCFNKIKDRKHQNSSEIKIIKEHKDAESQKLFKVGSIQTVENSQANELYSKGYAVPVEKEIISSVNIEDRKEEASQCSKCNFKIFPEDRICPNCMHDVLNETKSLKLQAQSLTKTKQNEKISLSKRDKLLELKNLFDDGLITEQDYEVARRKIIDTQCNQ